MCRVLCIEWRGFSCGMLCAAAAALLFLFSHCYVVWSWWPFAILGHGFVCMAPLTKCHGVAFPNLRQFLIVFDRHLNYPLLGPIDKHGASAVEMETIQDQGFSFDLPKKTLSEIAATHGALVGSQMPDYQHVGSAKVCLLRVEIGTGPPQVKRAGCQMHLDVIPHFWLFFMILAIVVRSDNFNIENSSIMNSLASFQLRSSTCCCIFFSTHWWIVLPPIKVAALPV